MYKNLYFDRKTNQVHLWTDGKHADKLYETFNFKRYAYLVDPTGDKLTLTGLKVKKVHTWGKEAEKAGMIFEHDVPTSTRVLIDRYYQTDDVSVDHTILFFDIEVEKGLKYSTAKEAKNKITSIAYYDTNNKKYVCLLLDENNKIEDCTRQINGIDVYVKVYRTETNLLSSFIGQWNKIKPSIISTWNGDVFDLPYLYNRTINVLGINWANKLSPIEIVEQRDINKRDIVITIAGIAQMDYLQLYKKFTYNEESSYTLEAISQKELGRGKMKYEGTLDNLYETNLDEFIEYNVNDVELIVAIDKKMDLIEIARGICHKGHVPYDDFQFSSKYLDGAILARCKRKEVVTVSNSEKDGGKAIGAFVKPPQIGKHSWVYSLDFQSLYPSVIITQNISPETQIGVIEGWDSLILTNKLVDGVNLHDLSDFGYLTDSDRVKVRPIVHDLFSDTSTEPMWLTKSEFVEYVNKHNATISSAGVMFQTLTKGIIPEILEGWFEERQMFKKKMKEYEVGSEMYIYYDRMQLITKILLNSLYGVLLLPSFRYYSKLNGESVTRSGQSLIKFADFMANLVYKKRLGNEYKANCVLYGDSDSVYLSGNQAITNIETKTEIEVVRETEKLSDEVCQFLNRAVGWFAKHCFHSNNNRLIFNQEKVSKRAFWGQAKKRYAQLSVSIKDDQLVEKLDIKGFDVVRSSFPKAFRKILKELIIDILHDATIADLNAKIRKFKKEYANSPLNDIMLPTGVKEMSKYDVGQKGTPIYYKAAQNYNSMLNLHKIETLPKIDDGDKIIYAYMKTNPFGFDTMALRGYDDPPEIVQFVERFIDKEKVFENAFLSKVETIWEDLNFGKVQLQEESNFF